jgi:hypothetical protein
MIGENYPPRLMIIDLEYLRFAKQIQEALKSTSFQQLAICIDRAPGFA